MSETSIREAVYSEDYYDLIVEYGMNIDSVEQKYRNSMIQSINSSYAIIHIPRSEFPPLSYHTYRYSSIPACLTTMDLSAAEGIGSVYIQNQLNLSLSGQGVLIGFVDTGIDYTNPLFINNERYSRIFSLWDQTIESGPSPDGFYYGTEYTTEVLNLALQSENPHQTVPSRDEIGHGTKMAALAAGNQNRENGFSGIASGSQLVVVKLKPAKKHLQKYYAIPDGPPVYQSTDIMLGIRYLVTVAERLQRPMVICIGLGTNMGGLGSRNVLVQYLETIGNAAGFCVVTAIGNEGLAGHTFLGSLTQSLTSQNVELHVGNETGFTMELWGRAPNIYTLGLISPLGEYIQRIPIRFFDTANYDLLIERTRIRIDTLMNEKISGHPMISITFTDPTPGIWTLEIYKESYDNSNFILRLPTTGFISSDTYFLRSTPEYTQVTPSTTISCITATAYNHHSNAIFPQASWGFVDNFQIKPDIAAPGVNLVVPDLSHGFTVASGTSYAAAIVAGSAALILELAQVRRNLSAPNSIGIKNFLIRGADRDPNVVYPNKIWGYGRMNLYQSYERLLRV